MTKKNPEKKAYFFEPKFDSVLVCKKNTLRPYIEIFSEGPENVEQKNLGDFMGILEVTDDSEESSYIVNYLVSVMKKEYYSKPKRGAVESFEAALHKANLALSKLAEHESTNWVGKINSVIAAIEKNNLHLARTGKAHAFLIRKKSMTDIAGDEPQNEIANPIKTFTDILSGKLENGDRLILTSDHLFEIFSPEEIKRSSLKFSLENFIQFLRTALVNELDQAAVLVGEIKEKEKIFEAKRTASKTLSNAFSQSAFSRSEKRSGEFSDPEEKQTIIEEIQEEIFKKDGDFVDKNGHIYIKEDQFIKEDSSGFSFDFPDFGNWFLKIKKNLGKISFRSKIDPGKNLELKGEKETAAELPKNKFQEEIILHLRKIKNRTFLFAKRNWPRTRFFFAYLILGAFSLGKKFFRILGRAARTLLPDGQGGFGAGKISRFFPDFGKIKKIYLLLDRKQRVYALLAIFFVFILPYFFVRWQKNQALVETKDEISVEIPTLPLKDDKNISRIESLGENNLEKEIVALIFLNEKVYAVGKGEIIDPENKSGYPFPDGFGEINFAVAMEDLKLAFITDKTNRIISWSPINQKYQNQSISLPENSQVLSGGTFLTYLYLLDPKNNQIYRYPRGGEGFAQKSDWLRGGAEISTAKEMAVSEAIYLTNGNTIEKFFKNKKEEFNLEPSVTPFSIDKIFVRTEGGGIYFLDRKNSRIVRLDLLGNIANQFYNSEIANASSFLADEKNGKVYFSSGNRILNFSLNQ